MTLYEQLQEVEAEIRVLEHELQHPWSMDDQAFLEEELEKWCQYRRKLQLQLAMNKTV